MSDTDSGSAKKDLAQVFQPFFTTGKKHGTGLGLAICRNIAEAHGGDITLTSEPGRGTNESASGGCLFVSFCCCATGDRVGRSRDGALFTRNLRVAVQLPSAYRVIRA